jgi:hypothetical protein
MTVPEGWVIHPKRIVKPNLYNENNPTWLGKQAVSSKLYYQHNSNIKGTFCIFDRIKKNQ